MIKKDTFMMKKEMKYEHPHTILMLVTENKKGEKMMNVKKFGIGLAVCLMLFGVACGTGDSSGSNGTSVPPNSSTTSSTTSDTSSTEPETSAGTSSETPNQSVTYTDDAMVYASDSALAVSVDFGSYELKEAFVDGQKTTEITQTATGLSLSKTLIASMRYGVNKVSFTDTENVEHNFIVAKGVTANDIFYYDFDTVGANYSNTNTAAVPTTVTAGIDGNSLHAQKTTDGGLWFSLRQNGDFGFPSFTFTEDTEYLLSFDFKIQSGTADKWWSPIRFEGNGDVVYFGNDIKTNYQKFYTTPAVNSLYSQATVTTNTDGSLHLTAVFRTTSATTNLEFPNWGGAMDMLVDNILVEKLNPNITRVACVGDSITEATLTNVSYPQALQEMLGYDDYFVFNFGKSGSNVIEAGALPYRTWAEWQYQYLLTWQPDIIVTQLGTNDGRFDNSGIQAHGDSVFIQDYNSLIDEFETLADQVYINISPYAFGDEYGIEATAINEHIVNVEGYIAHKQGLSVFDVFGATKGLDRANYFPDYIHGSDAGYAEIAKAVYKGLTEGPSVNKYLLKYALDCNTASDDTNYNSALAVYNNPNATQKEVESAFALIESEMGTPSYAYSRWTPSSGERMVYTQANGEIVLPITMSGNTVKSLKIGDTVFPASSCTVGASTVTISAETVNTVTKGFYTAELEVTKGKGSMVHAFFAYVGYAQGECLILDGDKTSYSSTSAADIISPCQVVDNGIDGKSLQFSPIQNATNNGTMLEVRPSSNAGFGFPTFEFQANQTYSLSFQYKVLEGTANNWYLRIWWSSSATHVILADLSATTMTNAVSSASWVKDDNDVITFSVTFTTPAENINSLSLSNFNASNILIDNLVIGKV